MLRSRSRRQTARAAWVHNDTAISPRLANSKKTVKEWDDVHRMVISIDSAKKLPIAHGEVTFVLSPFDDATEVSLDYAYQPKFGLLGEIIGRVALDRQLTKGFRGFLKDLDTASQR